MKEVHVLRPPRQHQRTRAHRHDSELDRVIAAHRRRHAGRLAMLGVDHRGLLARHLDIHHHNARSFK